MQKRAQNFFFKKCLSFSELTGTVDAENISTIQILRTGHWDHPVYGSFTLTGADLEEFVFNFNSKVRGVDLCVDDNHDGQHRAVGWYRKVFRDGQNLFAEIEWNDTGLQLINSKTYRYFSPELFFSYRDEETGTELRNVLVGGGITNRPFFKGMQALKMSEPDPLHKESSDSDFYFLNTEPMKKTFAELAAELKPLEKISKAQFNELQASFNELPEAEQGTAKVDLDEAETRQDDTIVDPAPVDPTPADPIPADPAPLDPPADPTPEALEASEKFSEEAVKHLGMTLPQIKEMQQKFSEMGKVARFAEIEKQTTSHVYSESNKAGTILPKAKDKIAKFAEKLPDTLVKEFFEILSGKPFRTVEFKELGGSESGGASMEFNIPSESETPENVTRGSFVLDFVAKKFQEAEKGLSYEVALSKAVKHIEQNSIV